MRATNSREKSIMTLDIITSVLLIIGGLNWLLIGLFRFDVVLETLGRASWWLAALVYILVGLSAIVQAVLWKHIRTETYHHVAPGDERREPIVQH